MTSHCKEGRANHSAKGTYLIREQTVGGGDPAKLFHTKETTMMSTIEKW